jgi:hypothetical protein
VSFRYPIVLLAVFASLISQGAGPNISDFGTNGVLSADDLKRFLIQKRYPSFRMSSVSNEALTQKVFAKPLSEVGIDFRTYHFDPNTNRFSMNDVMTKIKLINEQGDISLFNFRIRDKWQDIKYFDPGDQTQEEVPYSKGKAATFAYTHDFRTNGNTWSIHGAIFREFPFTDCPLIGPITFVPSATLDKVQTADLKKRVDSLIFRGAAVKNIPPAKDFYQDMRAGALYATDVSFRSAQVGGELEWEPLQNHWGLGAYKGFYTNSPVLYRLQAFVHAEVGDILDAGRNTNLKEGAGFFRIGPFAQVELKPIFWDRLTLTARWEEYEALASGAKSTRLFTTGASIAFDPKEHFTLEIKYKKGRQPLTAEKQETFELALGVKF